MDFNKTSQKQLTEIDRKLLLGFKTTSNLSQSLQNQPGKKPGVHPALLFSSTKTKEYLQQAHKELAMKAHDPVSKEKFLMESDVKSLISQPKPQSNPRTQEMIAKQKESRRQRHIAFVNEFEKVIETLQRTTDGNCEGIKQEINNFFEQSGQTINKYLDSLTDGELLTRELDFIQDLNETIREHKEKRSDKLFSLYNLLKGQETERQNTIAVLCEKLQEDLVETAFFLEDDVKALVKEKTQSLEKDCEEFGRKNQAHLEDFNRIQVETFEKFEELSHLKEKRWRFLKHEEALRNFRTDIQTLDFVNPRERVRLFQQLREKHAAFFEQRRQFLKKLAEIDMKSLSKNSVEKLSEDYQVFVAKTNEIYDKLFDALLKEHENSQEKARKLLRTLSSRLELVQADVETPVNEIVSKDCEPFVQRLDEHGKKLLNEAIKFVEDSDARSNEIIMNVCKVLARIGGKFDDHKREILNKNHLYEVEKAKLADSNDECLENLNAEFENLKVQLQQSLHHPMLEENLAKVFGKIDELEREYREFHTKNTQLARGHPETVEKMFAAFEGEYARLFELVGFDRKEELQQRNLKRAQEKVQKLIEEEEIARIKEDERIAEENKKKGGKPAASSKPKQKDPKKAAQELELRQKELLEKIGVESLEFFESPMGNKFILSMSLQEFVENKLFISANFNEDVKETGAENGQNEGKFTDFKYVSPVDPENLAVLDENVVFSFENVRNLVKDLRNKTFEFLNAWKAKTLTENEGLDKDFVENSILILDERLKKHYPLKGQMEVELFSTRSAQITEHKKKYERHTRTTLQKLNLQSEEFNFLLEECLKDLKNYEEDQTSLRNALPNATSLPKIQGILNTVRENFYKFNEKIIGCKEQLEVLVSSEMEKLLGNNADFLENCKLFEDGGSYSKEEVLWYGEMLKEISEQISKNQAERAVKSKEMLEVMEKKKQEMLDSFEKHYAVALEELACREGTGKKYGKPRRLYQERLRTEMTKCEKAQEGIDANIEKIKELYKVFSRIKETGSHEDFLRAEPSFSLQVRRILMRIRTCMAKYSSHINALKPDAKATDMPRVTYNELSFTLSLDPQEIDKDKIYKEEELEDLGLLYFQKETRVFVDWLAEIEKNVREEAQKIYTGSAAKFLTGADKIPDYLRVYLNNMKKQAEDFRISCVRYLRNSCEEISRLSKEISQLVLESLFFKHFFAKNSQKRELQQDFSLISEENAKSKEVLTFQLRPNLSNPSCKDELDSVCAKESQRNSRIFSAIEEFREKFLDNSYTEATQFFKALTNNFEFLLLFFDNLLLFEDFVRLPGDEQIAKKHDSIKTLLKRKQKGTLIDTSSERSISKIWPGLLVNSFNIGNRKLEYSGNLAGNEAKAEKNPAKNAKKDNLQEISEKVEENTREIKSFKTFRQKAAVKLRQSLFERFKKEFDAEVAETQGNFSKMKYEEEKYQFYWEQKVFKLLNPDFS